MRDFSLAVRGLALRRVGDEDVFERALSHDPVAFAECYRRYRSRIYGFCLSMLLSAPAAEDATQEVFLRLLDAKPGSISHPRAWLFAVARNVSVDGLRQRRSVDDEPLEAESLERLPVTADSEEEAIAHETAGAVFLALRRLNPRYRAALILRDMHGESSESIAEALGMSPSAVDTLACRARDSFGRAYSAVSLMPSACRDAVTLAYKATGTGISEIERGRLDAHVQGCSACRREVEKASDARWLPAMLPFILTARPSRRVFAEAFQLLRGPLSATAEQAPALVPPLPRLAEGAVAVLAAGVMMAGVADTPVAGRTALVGEPLASWEAPAAASAESLGQAATRLRARVSFGEKTASGTVDAAGGTGAGYTQRNGATYGREDAGGASAASGGSGGSGETHRTQSGASGPTGGAGTSAGGAGGGATGGGSGQVRAGDGYGGPDAAGGGGGRP